jgi:hypothetical protein
MTEIRNELPYMQLKERYVRVKIKGTRGPVCICEPGEVSDFCDGGDDEYELEDVYMTMAEVEAMAEFEGF